MTNPPIPLLTRHPNNPLLTADDPAFPCSLLFNAGICKYQGQYAMVFRNDYGPDQAAFEAGTNFAGTNLGLAFSDDGIDWTVEPQPCISLDKARTILQPLYPGQDMQQVLHRFYDPRLTVIDGRVHMCFAVDTRFGLCGGIAVTDDFDHWQILSLSAPDNRNMVLFPDKVNGDYVRLERPFNQYGPGNMRPGLFGIWLSRSPDLQHWGQTRHLLGSADLPYANDKIGPGAPPIKTDRGYLAAIHGVYTDHSRGKNGWEDKWPKTYYAGLMLLDPDDPTQILGLLREPLLTPEVPYETDTGFRTDVIFPGGMLLEDTGEVKLYYGAADTVECLATAHVDDLVNACLDAGPPPPNYT
ncbi:MAG: glycoside hydrolase family 130 protein [Planctomycetota bacterium]